MNAMLPMVVLLSEPKDRRRDMADALLPAIVPVPASSRLALSAVVAGTAVRRQEVRSAQVVDETLTAATTEGLDAAALERFDRLSPILARRPDLRDRLLDFSTSDVELGDAVVGLVTALTSTSSTEPEFDLDSAAAEPLRRRLSLEQRKKIVEKISGSAPDEAIESGNGKSLSTQSARGSAEDSEKSLRTSSSGNQVDVSSPSAPSDGS